MYWDYPITFSCSGSTDHRFSLWYLCCTIMCRTMVFLWCSNLLRSSFSCKLYVFPVSFCGFRFSTIEQNWAATSENIPANLLRSRIKVFTRHISESQWCKLSPSGQRRLWSDCADEKADLSLRWANMSEGTFSTLLLKWIFICILSDFHGNIVSCYML